MFANKNNEPMKADIRLFILTLMLVCTGSCANATPLPKSYTVYLDLFCADMSRWRDRTGASYYIWVTDYYTKERKMMYPQKVGNGHIIFEYDVYFPTYNVVNTRDGKTIPFYIEPYDSLMIDIDYTGYPLLYRNPDGSQYEYANMLTHDISTHKLYTSADYDNDRDNSTFATFTDKLTSKMNHTLDSINRIADFYKFTQKEREIATYNARMQYLLWMFEFTTFRTHMLQEYASKHSTGWQNIDTDDEEIDAMTNPRSYACMTPLLNNIHSLSSQYLDVFLNDYDNSEILRHDLYLYAGDTKEDSVRMDSAICARDMQITGLDSPSELIRIITERKYVDIPEDRGIMLKETKIIANRFAKPKSEERVLITKQDIMNAKSFQAPTGFNILAPISYGVGKLIDLIKKKRGVKPSNRQKILDLLEEEDRTNELIRKGLR